jgi:arginine deiminase
MLRVTSETGRLRRVLVHEPGPEVDRMVPSMMDELLFDDILYGAAARDEHRRFRQVLRLLGIEVVEVRHLLAEALATEPGRAWLLDVLLADLPPAVNERLRSASPDELSTLLAAGLRFDPHHRGIESEELFDLPPLPNWCFQRDPQIVIGSNVMFGVMASPARWREAVLARTIFRYHPDLQDASLLADPLLPEDPRPLLYGLHRPHLEGGDVTVLSPDVVAVGHSQRTNRNGIRHLARSLRRSEDGPRWLLAVVLPQRRAYMHLDTVFTVADRDACVVFPPVVTEASPEQARVYEYDLHASELRATAREALLPTLASRGVDLEPIPCGGDDPVVQQREQWTDGANVLALAPGIVVLYDRNLGTLERLGRHGFRAVAAEDLLLGRADVDLDRPARVAIVLPSHEISRARGGPHCLTHPLVRDEM